MTAPKTKAPLPETGGVLTRTLLESELANIRKQKEQALTVFRQAEGAEHVLTKLIERFDESQPGTA